MTFRLCSVASVSLAIAFTHVTAQDLSRTPNAWLPQAPTADELPISKLESPLAPPATISKLDRPSYARVRARIDDAGYVLSQAVVSELPWLDSIYSPFDTTPARRGGQAVDSDVEYFVVFNPASAPVKGPTASGRLIQPATVFVPGTEGTHAFFEFEFSVDAGGQVTAMTPLGNRVTPALVARAIKTMPQWKFSAARRDGQATASTIVAPVLFLVEPPQEPSKTGDSYPVAIHRVPPMYPFKARQYGVTGEVLLHLIVGADGVPTKVKAVHSTHRLFADAAVEAVGKWRFKPGKANGKPVASSMVQPMTFSLGDEPSVSQPLKIKQDPSKLAKLPPELQWDVAPEYLPINPAVYPFEAYAAKKEGSAQFAFVVGPTGKIVERQTVKATGPEFEGAARAMLDTFKLRPASKNGRPSSALLGLTIEFQLKGNGLVQIDDETREVMKRLSEHRDTFVNAEALTHPLVPLSHLGPVFPSDVTDVSSGEAVIEFVISRTGAALLPKVISATSPSFGYAAAQAVGSWQFEAPVKDTKVVEVITRETVTFTRKK